ncbi:hypothetical protein MKW98_013065, partial [Papaver atlanticum]
MNGLRFLQVPKGQGDNIYASQDSRQFGPVPYGLKSGTPVCGNCKHKVGQT